MSQPQAKVVVNQTGGTEFGFPGVFSGAERVHGLVERPLMVVETQLRGVENPAHVHHDVARVQHGRVAGAHDLSVWSDGGGDSVGWKSVNLVSRPRSFSRGISIMIEHQLRVIKITWPDTLHKMRLVRV